MTHGQARAATVKWEQIIDYPSDLGVLCRINTWILGEPQTLALLGWDEELRRKLRHTSYEDEWVS